MGILGPDLHCVGFPTAGSSISENRRIATMEDSRNKGAHFSVKDPTDIVVFLPEEGVQPVALISAAPEKPESKKIRTKIKLTDQTERTHKTLQDLVSLSLR